MQKALGARLAVVWFLQGGFIRLTRTIVQGTDSNNNNNNNNSNNGNNNNKKYG